MRWMMPNAAMLLMSSCVAGNFCDVARPLPISTAEVAQTIHAGDPDLEGRIISHNRYGKAHCGWDFN